MEDPETRLCAVVSELTYVQCAIQSIGAPIDRSPKLYRQKAIWSLLECVRIQLLLRHEKYRTQDYENGQMTELREVKISIFVSLQGRKAKFHDRMSVSAITFGQRKTKQNRWVLTYAVFLTISFTLRS